MPSAHAATGRIAFSGAVLESTCTTEAGSAAAAIHAAATATVERQSCGGTATDSGRSYSRTVASVVAANLVHDPLLAYFASYAGPAAAGNAAAKVIVQTYD
ncbi:hypothetical protein PY254_00625 [Rhodanobacter sp. AS-Z3]|uniref:hypothetical protein n=1 Tax=Rhodanobacter sp. AS-Z3 TaxID=3031330 RepID=UPI00247963C2|nr:hypothetical protein [Rhodanobacter sp. AS-Z3]WEN15219.1 hypothetical protein PY254_00625 [Rhodanobacter sp. AS-Z3]